MHNNLDSIIYGIHPIIELLRAKKRKLYSIYTVKAEPKAFLKIKNLLPNYVKINYVDKNVLTKMAQTTDHQSVVAQVAPFVFRTKLFDPTKHKFLVVLDGIQDPRNLGAILRSAFCTAIDGVILSDRGSAPINSVALKSSAGLAEYLQIYKASNLLSTIKDLKKTGYNIYLAAFSGINAIDVDYHEPVCIVIGSEGKGISKDILKLGQQITLPQVSNDISYNASVAAGILLFIVSSQNKRI